MDAPSFFIRADETDNLDIAQMPIDEIVDETERKVRGWGSVEIRDNAGELIPIGEFQRRMDTFMKRGGPIIDGHTNRQVGKVLNYEIKDHPDTGMPGVLLTYIIYSDYKIDDVVWDEIKSGKRKGLSVGGAAFDRNKTKTDKETGEKSKLLQKLEIYEFSSVHNPCNPLALNTEVNMMAKSDQPRVIGLFLKDKDGGFGSDKLKQLVGWLTQAGYDVTSRYGELGQAKEEPATVGIESKEIDSALKRLEEIDQGVKAGKISEAEHERLSREVLEQLIQTHATTGHDKDVKKPDAQGNYTPPESGSLPEHGKKILGEAYSACRRDGGDKEKCARIAWRAVRNAGYTAESYAKSEGLEKAYQKEDETLQRIRELARNMKARNGTREQAIAQIHITPALPKEMVERIIDEEFQKRGVTEQEKDDILAYAKHGLWATEIARYVHMNVSEVEDVINQAKEDGTLNKSEYEDYINTLNGKDKELAQMLYTRRLSLPEIKNVIGKTEKDDFPELSEINSIRRDNSHFHYRIYEATSISEVNRKLRAEFGLVNAALMGRTGNKILVAIEKTPEEMGPLHPAKKAKDKNYHSVFDTNEKLSEDELDEEIAGIESRMDSREISHIESGNLPLFSQRVQAIWRESRKSDIGKAISKMEQACNKTDYKCPKCGYTSQR